VPDKLAGLSTRITETQAVNDIVEAPFKENEEVLPGDTGKAGRFLKRLAELSFEKPVSKTRLLLLAKLQATVGNPAATRSMRPRRGAALIKRAFGNAFLTLEHHLLAYVAAQAALWFYIPCHSVTLVSVWVLGTHCVALASHL